MQAVNLKSYAIEYITMPSRPDIDRIIVVPLKTVFINKTAKPGANVTRLAFDGNEKVPRFERFPPVQAKQWN